MPHHYYDIKTQIPILPLLSSLLASLLASYIISARPLQDILLPPFDDISVVGAIFRVVLTLCSVAMAVMIPSPHVYGSWSIRTHSSPNGAGHHTIRDWKLPDVVSRIISDDSHDQIITSYATSRRTPYEKKKRPRVFFAKLQHDRPTSINVKFPSRSLYLGQMSLNV